MFLHDTRVSCPGTGVEVRLRTRALGQSNPTGMHGASRGSYLLSLLQSTDGAVEGDDVWCQFLTAWQTKWIYDTTNIEIRMVFVLERAA